MLFTPERQYYYENRHFKNEASVALNLLVSLFGQFVACGGRKRGNRHTHTDKQTDRQTDTQTDTQTNYYNPRAHARRGLITFQQTNQVQVCLPACTNGSGERWASRCEIRKPLHIDSSILPVVGGAKVKQEDLSMGTTVFGTMVIRSRNGREIGKRMIPYTCTYTHTTEKQ